MKKIKIKEIIGEKFFFPSQISSILGIDNASLSSLLNFFFSIPYLYRLLQSAGIAYWPHNAIFFFKLADLFIIYSFWVPTVYPSIIKHHSFPWKAFIIQFYFKKTVTILKYLIKIYQHHIPA